MTNQNPAVPQPNSGKLDRDILAKVNAHTDRSIDRLFADIDELLSGDLENEPHSAPAHHSNTVPSSISSRTEPAYQQDRPPTYPPQSQFAPPHSAKVELEEPSSTATPKQKKGLPLWLKALLGLGATSIAVGGGLVWLINERKIEVPKNIDTSWFPFQSQQVSSADANFADYMRKSLSKIESANTPTTSVTNPVNPSANIAAPIATQAAPIAANPTIAATIPVTTTPPAAKNSIALIKTVPTGNRPGAIFQIDSQSKTVNVGQKIGTSDWSLLTVAKGEVILKRKGGEIRSIYVGQKF
jgi:hypothetical protein